MIRIAFLVFCALAASATAAPLAVKVVLASEPSLNATSTLLLGEKDAVLVDVPFTRSDGHRLVAEVLETGRTLRTIYISHDHPDHFLSLEVLAEAFPNARIITAAPVVEGHLAFIAPEDQALGTDAGCQWAASPGGARGIAGNSFTLEGNEIRVLGPMQGDHVHATALWVPSIGALIAGDLLFADVHRGWVSTRRLNARHGWVFWTSSTRFIRRWWLRDVAAGVPDYTRALKFTRRVPGGLRDLRCSFEGLRGPDCATEDAFSRRHATISMASSSNNSAQVRDGRNTSMDGINRRAFLQAAPAGAAALAAASPTAAALPPAGGASQRHRRAGAVR